MTDIQVVPEGETDVAEIEIPDNEKLPIHTIEVARLWERGWSQKKIAKTLGCAQSTVNYHIQKAKRTRTVLKDFQDNTALILEGLLHDILSTLDMEAIKNAPLQTRVWAFGVIYDKLRLERGQSTANVDIHSVISDIRKKEEEIQRRLKRLGAST